MVDNLETMLRNRLQIDMVHALDSATQAGDIQAARRAAQQLQEFAVQNKPAASTPKFTNADIRASLKVKAPWFGVDPRRSARVVEFGKNMEPESFQSADAFADEIIKAVAKEYEEMEEVEENDEPEDEEPEQKAVARKRTDAPSDSMARAVPRRSSGPWTKFSDAPKEIAQQIKASADKFTRNATKEQREKYIVTALGTAYAADQRSRGKK